MKKKKGLGLLAKQKAAGWGFLAPASILIFVMSFYPMVQAFITSLKTGSSANIQDYSNPRVDELCELAVATSDTAKREAYYKEAIELILNDCIVAIVASPQEYFLASPALKGFAPNASNANNFSGVTLEK